MGSDDERNYEVGYGKPPKATRFKKGTSGNPAGRPRGSKNLNTLLNKELDQLVVVRENGREKRITKRQASAKQVANKMTAGDHRYLPFFTRLMEKEEIQAAVQRAVDAGDEGVIDPEFARQLQEAWKKIRNSQAATAAESQAATTAETQTATFEKEEAATAEKEEAEE